MIARTDSRIFLAWPWLWTPQSTSIRQTVPFRRTVTRNASPKPTLYIRTVTVDPAISGSSS